jgi:ATP-binding cassette subfamily B protein
VKLNDPLSAPLSQDVASRLQPGETIRFCKKSDLSLDRKFGEATLAVTDTRVLVLDTTHVVVEVPFTELDEVAVEELFSSSRLEAKKKDGSRVELIYYSKVLVPEFGVFCRAINQLVRKEPPLLPDEDEATHCARCGSPLPERGSNCPLCVPRWTIFRRLFQYVKPFKVRIGILLVTLFISVGVQMVPPYITKRIVDDVIKGGNQDSLLMWIGLMFGCFTIYLVTRLFNAMMSSWLAAHLVANLRAELHTVLQRLQLGYFNKRGSGELVGRVMHDTAELQQFLIEGLPYLMVNTSSFFFVAVILLRMDWRLAVLVFLPVPFLIFGAEIFWKRLHPLFHKQGFRIESLYSILGETINGIRVVKAFAQEKTRSSQFNRRNDELRKIRFQIDVTFISFQEVMFWVMQLGIMCVWFFAAQRLSRHDPSITLGTLLAFVGYIWLLYGPLQWFTVVMNWMTHAFAGGERVFAVLDTPPEAYDSATAIAIPEVKGAVSFKDVRFSYERGKEIIKGISFDIAPGEMIGLVGKSGAGKSTIINLVCRFFEADSGLISVDGHDIKQIRLADLRNGLGMVLQETFLFNGTVLDNLKCGKPDATFEEVVRATKAANAHDFILDKEDGYDTRIGEHGAQLSGGEKQRLAIARAILHDPAILILDEATSSVDSETEKHIQEAIANLVRNRTTIAIAHRLATLRNAHRLVVLDDGKIAEMGTHDELMAKEGAFAKMIDTQTELNKLRGETWTV